MTNAASCQIVSLGIAHYRGRCPMQGLPSIVGAQVHVPTEMAKKARILQLIHYRPLDLTET